MPRAGAWVAALLAATAACASEPSPRQVAAPEVEPEAEPAPGPGNRQQATGDRQQGAAERARVVAAADGGASIVADGGALASTVVDGGALASPVADGGAVVASADGGALAVPPENRERGTRPDDSTAVEGSRRLLEAFQRDDPAVAADFFFPGEAFDLVKAMAVPSRYFRRLFGWYQEDVHAEHARFRDLGELAFDRFQMGRCAWQDVGTEGNKLPYWSCRHNLLFARSAARTRSFEIHVLINWGPRWYITHLGPIRS